MAIDFHEVLVALGIEGVVFFCAVVALRATDKLRGR